MIGCGSNFLSHKKSRIRKADISICHLIQLLFLKNNLPSDERSTYTIKIFKHQLPDPHLWLKSFLLISDIQITWFIINKSHKLYIRVRIILNAVILSHFNNTAVTRANLSHRLVIINKICFTL